MWLNLVLVLLLAVHGAVHVVGFARSRGVAGPGVFVSRRAGLAWLGAAALFASAAAAVGTRWWVLLALPAVMLSQGLIISAWKEARSGTAVNAALLVPILLAALDASPTSLASRFAAIEHAPLPTSRISATELEGLPAPARRWLTHIGVVGHARIHGFDARFHGALRDGPDDGFLQVQAWQKSDITPTPARAFFLTAHRAGLPVAALHLYRAGTATMEVRAAGIVDVVDARGPALDRSETVTVLNDLCLLAPAALLDAGVEFAAVDDDEFDVRYRVGAHAVSARLRVSSDGDLVDFVSDDRLRTSDGKTHEPLRWSTPISSWGTFDGLRLPTRATARWGEGAAAYTYADLVIDDVDFR